MAIIENEQFSLCFVRISPEDQAYKDALCHSVQNAQRRIRNIQVGIEARYIHKVFKGHDMEDI